VRLDAIPVGLDEAGELLERLEALPAQCVAPLVEEPPCPAGSVVLPELGKGLLEKVGLVEALVGLEQCRTENKVALGFVKGLNNKVRVIQRRAELFSRSTRRRR
jgi:hypothetical protein